MIFPDVTVEEWARRYDLKPITRECDACGAALTTTLPFLETGYAGLRTPKCTCGKNRFAASTMVTTTPEAHSEWSRFTGE